MTRTRGPLALLSMVFALSASAHSGASLWNLLEPSGGMSIPIRRGSFQANQRKGGR